MDRRTFIKGAAAAGAALVGADTVASVMAARGPAIIRSAPDRPNILFIMVDQMRYPQWFPDQSTLDSLLPSLAHLRGGAVSFGRHYTASNACTPARSALVTGLYTHQTGCLLTSNPGLHSGFPTWGTMLRSMGYQTFWYGKWHLSTSCNLDPYGFSGGTCPSPNGKAGEGLAKDPSIADQFISWLQQQGDKGPWCTTVSFVNPHDISYFYRYTNQIAGEMHAPSVITTLPPNFETATMLAANKPRLQTVTVQGWNELAGVMPDSGPYYEDFWLKMLNVYLLFQQYVDKQIGRVLDALEANQSLAKRTIIVFTADHGEYAGSHGLRNKAYAAYEEAIRIPFYVKDPTGQYTTHPEIERQQLTSSVDVAPLLLTLASGNGDWRHQSDYAQIADRFDMAKVLADPHAKGRPYILHVTDEMPLTTASATGLSIHIIAIRTTQAKLAIYSVWTQGTTKVQTQDQEFEFYDYGTDRGRMELDNIAALQPSLYKKHYDNLMHHAIPNELHKALPKKLQSVQQSGTHAYLSAVKPHQPGTPNSGLLERA